MLTACNNDYIGKDKAKEIALKESNLTKGTIEGLNVELEKENNKAIYEVEFVYDGYEYTYYIDATSGEVLHYESEFDD